MVKDIYGFKLALADICNYVYVLKDYGTNKYYKL